MAVAPVNQIGCVIKIVSGEPATYDETGYDALTMTEIQGVVSIPSIGDQSEQITVNVLKEGRTLYANGVKNFPAFVVPYIRDDTDAGQIVVSAANNTNTLHSILIEDNTGYQIYITGYVASMMDGDRDVSTYLGRSFEFRPTAAPVYGTA